MNGNPESAPAEALPLIKNQRRHRSQKGQGLVELAVILPLIVLILVGIADLGRMFYAYVTLTSAAEKGALYGSVSSSFASDTAGIESITRADATTLFESSASNPVVTSSTSTDPYGDQAVAVSVAYTFRPLFPYPGLPGTFTMTRSVSMRVKP